MTTASELVSKIRSTHILTEDNEIDVTELLDGYDATHVSSVELGSSRWSSHEAYTYHLSDDSFITFEVAQGLTENQDHYGVEDVYEAVPRTVTVTKYFKVIS